MSTNRKTQIFCKDLKEMKNMLRILFVCIIFCYCLFSEYAYGGPGFTTAEFLKLDVGAGPAGRAGAGLSEIDDAYSLFYNPAGLAGTPDNIITFMYNSYIAGIDHEFLACKKRINKGKILQGSIGAGISLINYVQEKITTISDPSGIGTGSFKGRDIAAQIGYARKIGSNLNVGISIKYVSSYISSSSAQGIGFDAGIQYKLKSINGVSMGAGVFNIGEKLKYRKESMDIPLLYKLGIGYNYYDKLNFCLDIIAPEKDDIYFQSGLELKYFNKFIFRSGYNSSNDTVNSVTLGIGYLCEKFSLDYAYSPFGDFNQAHRVSIDFRFDGRD